MKHFVHYLTRTITTRVANTGDLFYRADQEPDAGFDRPSYHVTRSKSGPAMQIEAGSTIWLFSSLKSPWGKLPPSLDAKFVVEGVEKMPDGTTRFHAAADSCWLPLADATSLLKTLTTVDRNAAFTALWPDPDQAIGNYLQSIRQLSNGDELVAYSHQLLGKDYEFISYRIKDGTRAAFLAAANLVKAGTPIFWDRYCLPRRLAERRELVSHEKLDEYLIMKLRKSSKVWGIQSKMYSAPGSYSLKEAQLAEALGKFNLI